jgi:hypothetical protein
MKLKIIEMKADHYNWSCNVPEDIKNEFEAMLKEIDHQLNDKKRTPRTMSDLNDLASIHEDDFNPKAMK